MDNFNPLNVEIGLINVIVNKQLVSSDFKDIKDYIEGNDADVKAIVMSAPNHPSYVTKTRFATQRDASQVVVPE